MDRIICVILISKNKSIFFLVKKKLKTLFETRETFYY